MHYNTTHLHGEELQQQHRKSATQNEVILRIFTTFQRGAFTASQIEDYLKRAGKHWLLTSIRRSISDLHRAGRLEKTERAIGPYGMPEYRWQLRQDRRVA